MSRAVAAAVSATLATLAVSCSDRAAVDRGVLAVELRITPERLGDLFGSTSSGAAFPAEATLDGEPFLAEVEAAGGYSLHYVKRTMNVRLRGVGFDGVSNYRLSTAEGDPAMLRPPLAFGVFVRLGLPTPRITPAALSVNGRYFGLYYLIERVDEDFFRRRGLPAHALYKTKGYATFSPGMSAQIDAYFELRFGDGLAELQALADLVESASPDALARDVFARVDREDAVRYLAAGLLTAHTDGFNRNLYLYSPGPGLPLRLVPWDLDKTWQRQVMSVIAATGRVWQDNLLFERLFAIDEVRAEVLSLLDDALRDDEAAAVFALRVELAATAIERAYNDDDALGGLRGLCLAEQARILLEVYGAWSERLQSPVPVTPLR